MHRWPSGERARSLWTTAIILLPICFLFLYGLAWVAVRAHVLFDEHLFINVGQGVLSHGYPFRDYAMTTGAPFFDHTPLFSYVVALPATLVGPFGFTAALYAGRMISALFGLGTVIMAFVVGREGRGTVSGVVAAVLVATNAYFVQLSWVIHMEVPMAFFLVSSLYLMMRGRLLSAGILIAVAVMLKEHALAFWLVAGVYVLVRHGWRGALKVTLPSVIAGALWAAAAYLIDSNQLGKVLNRWVVSAGGTNATNRRFNISTRTWLRKLALDIVGPSLTSITIVAVAIAAVRRSRIPPIAVVPLAYAALALASSFLLHLKEPRWLTGVMPMCAVAVALLVDWGAVARWLAVRDARAPEVAQPS